MIASIPMKVCAKPEPGIETNGELKPVAIALASIVLPVPGAPTKSRPRSRAARALEGLARLPEGDDPPHFLLRLFLPRRRASLTPHCVARLEAPDLRDAHDQHQAHEDREVGDEEGDEDDLHPERRRREDFADLLEEEADRAHPGALAAEEPDDRVDDDEHDRQAPLLAPVPGAAAARDVLLAQLLAVGAEEARPRDQSAEEESANPRKTITTPNVASSDQYHAQPLCWLNQM